MVNNSANYKMIRPPKQRDLTKDKFEDSKYRYLYTTGLKPGVFYCTAKIRKLKPDEGIE